MAASRPIYLDHHATTPVDPRVLKTMLPFFSEEFGNAASRSHVYGWKAEETVEQARGEIAALIGAEPREIIFTSGATESNNLAILGAGRAARTANSERDTIVTCATEHRAVLDPCKQLETEGFRIVRIGVDEKGLIDLAQLRAALDERTLLVSVMLANNEVGTIQPVMEIGKLAHEAGALFHCDAAQGIGKTPFNVRGMNVDLASISAHKLYGPKGVGALFVRRRLPPIRLTPLQFGGGHERGLRSGTLNVPAIAGFGAACAIYQQESAAETARVSALRDRLQTALFTRLDGLTLNGHPELRHPGNLNISFSGLEGESLLLAMKAIAVSAGSACTSAAFEPSHVLAAMGITPALAHAALRFGIGRFNTEAEIDFTADYVVETVTRLRQRAPAAGMAAVKAGKRRAG